MLRKKQHFIKIINHKLRNSHDGKDHFLLKLSSPLITSSCTSADYIDVSFASQYDSKIIEQDKYERWETSGYFLPKSKNHDESKKPFTMILPPPNVTGTLHLGHGLTITIQDILCRWKRMQDIPVLWVPGTDHAGIATQVVVEKNILKKKGLRLHDLKEEELLNEISKWKKDKENKINEQIKRLGASADWSRYTYTMDPKQSEVVQRAIIEMFDNGLIYKKNAFVNWCCHLRSTISDIEVDTVHVNGPTFISLPSYESPVQFGTMIEFAYKVCDSDDEICVATTRLETICGDVAVVVNPNDSRYIHLHGKFVWHPFRKCKLPIILDEAASPDVGTGALKLTPGHSTIDFVIAERHNLQIIEIISESGLLNENCGEWVNIPRYTAKDLILQKLQDMGLYRGTQNRRSVIPICSRTGDIVEHMIKPQWFLKCSDLSQKAIDVITNGHLQILPKSMTNVILNWLEYNQDWCLSRQISWGHKIPLFQTEHGWIAAKSIQEASQKAEKIFSQKCEKIVQEKDVIDTWFSSALLPFSVFGWPEPSNNDYFKYYPLSLMETGRDIACLWVARMIMLGLHFTKKTPFDKVVFHGLVCDSSGRKMSKSLGNVIELNHVTDGISLEELNETVYSNHKNGILSDDELKKALNIQKMIFSEGIPACGADALRFTLVSHNFLESIMHFDVKECQRVTHFCNKMWQAFRFSITWANKFAVRGNTSPNPTLPWHFWILHRLSQTVTSCNVGFEEMKFHEATSALKNFFINDLCDFYLEASKPVFHGETQNDAESTCSVLMYCLETYLRLLAPVMPHITEELYSYLPGNSVRITDALYPKSQQYEKWKNEKLEEEMLFIKNLISSIRGLQAEVKNFTNNEIIIVSDNEAIIQQYLPIIEGRLRCTIQFRSTDFIAEPAIGNTVHSHTKIFLKLKTELESLSNYIKLLSSKTKRLTKKLNKLEEKISTEKYAAKTSEETKKTHQTKIQELQDELNKIEGLKIKIGHIES